MGDHQEENGFFFVETLLLAFFVGALISFLGLLQGFYRMQNQRQDLLTASFLAREHLALLGTPSDRAPGSHPLSRTVNGRTYTIENRYRPTVYPGLQEAEVRISWMEAGRTRQSVFYRWVEHHE